MNEQLSSTNGRWDTFSDSTKPKNMAKSITHELSSERVNDEFAPLWDIEISYKRFELSGFSNNG